MVGTMSTEPVTIRQDRLKLTLTFTVLAGLTAVLAAGAAIASYLRAELWAYLGVTFLAPLALAGAVAATAAAWSFYRPGSLKLDDHALIYRAYWYERVYRRSDIEEFYVSTPTSRSRVPACALKSGRHVSFGRAWCGDASDIVERLSAARARWAADHPVSEDSPGGDRSPTA